MKASTRSFHVLALLTLSTSSTCAVNQSGDLSAGRTGDLSYPLAVRSAPDVELAAACSDGEVTKAGASALSRKPYVQMVSDRSARILWTAEGRGPASVSLTRPDGTKVATVSAEPDPGGMGLALAAPFHARLEGLEPGTIYCYALEDGGIPLTGRTGFRTAPTPGSGAPVRFVAFGDSGSGGDDQLSVLSQIETVPFDLILHTGDVAYDGGSLTELEIYVFDIYASLFRSFPFFPASGNHDYESNDGAPFRSVFALPGNERWYSFDWGDVHFVALDTERMGKEQVDWLDADLAATRKPWKVVYGHRPPFSSGHHGSDRVLRRWFVPILEKHRVDLVLSGHDHDYERIKPQGGVNYVVTGGGGRGTYDVGTSSFTAFSESVLNFVYVTIGADTLVLHAIDGSGKEFDQLVIHHSPTTASR